MLMSSLYIFEPAAGQDGLSLWIKSPCRLDAEAAWLAGGRAVSGVGRRASPPAERWVGTYLSPAPQAVPQAAGVSSGLSPAPQAVPQAADGSWDIFFFQPNKFESDI